MRETAAPGTVEELRVRVLGFDLTVAVWSPGDGRLPLLLAHDGPEYDKRAGLTAYAAAAIERGAVAPFRVALVPPCDRDQWYSASAAYSRALHQRVLPALCGAFAVAGPPVGLGASLGALALLHAQRRFPRTFAGLCLQSGSFFVPRFDRHESGFVRYGRIVRFVRAVLREASHPDPVPVVLTCGAAEENVHNNRVMARALAGQGYDAALHEVGGGHDFGAWGDALDPWLTGLLARLWAP